MQMRHVKKRAQTLDKENKKGCIFLRVPELKNAFSKIYLISIDVPLVGVNKKFGTSLLSAPPILHQSPQKLVYLDHAPHSWWYH